MFKILVPTDDSACSFEVIRHAAVLARGTDANVIVLHVTAQASQSRPSDAIEQYDTLPHQVSMLLQSLGENKPPLQYEERRHEGVPATIILQVADDDQVDLIVMGTAGHMGTRKLGIGSVAEEVCRRARCAVLTFKLPSEEPEADTLVPLESTDAS